MWLRLKNKSLERAYEQLSHNVFQRLELITNSSEYALLLRQNNQIRRQLEELKEAIAEYIVHMLNGRLDWRGASYELSKIETFRSAHVSEQKETLSGQPLAATTTNHEESFSPHQGKEPADTPLELVSKHKQLLSDPLPGSNTEKEQITHTIHQQTATEQRQNPPGELPATFTEATDHTSSMQLRAKDLEQVLLKGFYREAAELLDEQPLDTYDLSERAAFLVQRLIVQKVLQHNSEKTEQLIDRVIRQRFINQYDYSNLSGLLEAGNLQIPYIEKRLIQMKIQLIEMKKRVE